MSNLEDDARARQSELARNQPRKKGRFSFRRESKVPTPAPIPTSLTVGSLGTSDPEYAFQGLINSYLKAPPLIEETAPVISPKPAKKTSPKSPTYALEVQGLANIFSTLTHEDIIKLGASYDAIRVSPKESYFFDKALNKALEVVNTRVEDGAWGLASLRTHSLGTLPEEVNAEIRSATGFKPKYLKYRNRGPHKKWNTLWSVGDRASILLYATMAAIEARYALTPAEYNNLTHPAARIIPQIPFRFPLLSAEQNDKCVAKALKLADKQYYGASNTL